jgi:pSer/pThr/pTyr-binding forkhead associated (FHA) protein
MWKLTIEDDQASKTVVHLVRDEYTVGRAEDNTIRLTERNISRQHARLGKSGERWLLFDLRSYNGCYVNGQRVNGQHELSHGDLVQLGDYRLQAMDESIADPTASGKATLPAAPRSQALLGQPDRLVMVIGPTVGAEFPLSQEHPVVIGRGEECDVAINHPSVSRVHAEIHGLGDGRYEIVDRESANGVRVNGHELSRSLVDARDAIELGDVIMKFIPAGDIYVPGADESMQIAALTLGKPASTGGGLPMSVKIGVVIGGVAILTALGVAVATRKSFTPELAASAGDQPADSATRLLAEAKALLQHGDPAAAARKASELPEDSNARKSADFRQIEAAWADSLLAQASATNDPAQKRALLDQIARSTSVDSIRRNRAANDLAALAAASVDVADLPSTSDQPKSTGSAARPAVASAPTRAAAPPEQPASAPEPKPKPQQAVTPAPGKANTPATLVRKNPFD